MAENPEIVLNKTMKHIPLHSMSQPSGGFDVSNTTVYHPTGNKMRRADIKALECPKCSKILREPVQLITCGCRYCTSCIDEMLSIEK